MAGGWLPRGTRLGQKTRIGCGGGGGGGGGGGRRRRRRRSLKVAHLHCSGVNSSRRGEARRRGPPADPLSPAASALAAERGLYVLRLRDESRRLRRADLPAGLRVDLVDESAQRGARVRRIVRVPLSS